MCDNENCHKIVSELAEFKNLLVASSTSFRLVDRSHAYSTISKGADGTLASTPTILSSAVAR